jgi:hypothetical protein
MGLLNNPTNIPVHGNVPCQVGEIIYEETYATITLGNPKEKCRYFGICRVENWAPETPSVVLRDNQCVVKMLSYCEDQMYLEVLFLNEFLNSGQINTYFNSHFMIESPYQLTAANCELLSIKKYSTYFICKGQYICIPEEFGIIIRFNMASTQ